jgi:hypothetical protein
METQRTLKQMTIQEQALQAIEYLQLAGPDDAPEFILLAKPNLLQVLQLENPPKWVINTVRYFVYPLFWKLRKQGEI